MILISNQGNVTGPTKHANNPKVLEEVISRGIRVKTDLWVFPKFLLTGVDRPEYNISEFVLKNAIIEARNINAFEFILKAGLHGFYRGGSDLVYTNRGELLSYGPWFNNAIIMDTSQYTFEILFKSYGICSDFIQGFINEDSGNGERHKHL